MSDFDEVVNNLDQTRPFTEEDIPPQSPKKSTSRSPGRPRKRSREPREEEPPAANPTPQKKSPKVVTEALIKKVRAYKASTRFADRLSHVEINDDMNLQEAQTAYKECLKVLSHDFNRGFVKQLFSKGLQGTEMIMVHYLHITNVDGIADELLEDEEMMKSLDDELEELAIELDNYYQPGPLTRLIGKVAINVTEILKRRVDGSNTEEVEVDLGAQ